MSSHYILAFDFGTKSIGIAATNLAASGLTQSYTELKALPAREGIPNWDDLEAVLTEWQPQTVVVGLPVTMAGEDMEITRRARKFGNRLQGRFSQQVEFIEETLSTKAAKGEAFERGHKGNFNRQPVDSIAARLILESWIQHKHHSANTP